MAFSNLTLLFFDSNSSKKHYNVVKPVINRIKRTKRIFWWAHHIHRTDGSNYFCMWRLKIHDPVWHLILSPQPYPGEKLFLHFFKESNFPHHHRLRWYQCLYIKWSLLLGLKGLGVHFGIANKDFEIFDVEFHFDLKNTTCRSGVKMWGSDQICVFHKKGNFRTNNEADELKVCAIIYTCQHVSKARRFILAFRTHFHKISMANFIFPVKHLRLLNPTFWLLGDMCYF